MHIIKRELRANSKSLIIWCIVMILFIAMMVSEFSAYHNNPEMADVLDAMPEALMKAFSLESNNLTTPTGFISLASLYFYLTLGVFAVLIGSNIISKEERDKTAEFFLTLPVSREQVILSKWIAAIINCIVLTLVTSGAVIVSMLKYDLTSSFYEFMVYITITLFLFEMIFLSIGMFLASILKRHKTSAKISAAIIVFLYIISVVSSMTSKLSDLKYLTPFKYFEPNKFLTVGIEGKYIVITALIIVACMAGTFIIYPKRDLHL